MGDVKPWLWEKNPCVLPPCLFVTLFPHPTLSTSLMLQLVVGGVITEVVVVVGGCQPYPITHSTHVGHSSPSRTLPWPVRLPHVEPLLFYSRAGSSPSCGEGSASSSAHHFGRVFIRTHMRSCSPSRRGRVRFSSRTGHCAAGSHATGKGAAFQ